MSGNQAAFSLDLPDPVEGSVVRNWYEDQRAIDHYSRAAVNLGLWESEKKVFSQLFQPGQTLLDLGCGAGRITLGMWELGFRNLLGVDYSRPMIAEARRLSRLLEYGIAFRVGDATKLKLANETFDGVIFGFNGLMQMPGRDNRRRAIAEIRRVLVPRGCVVFTAHDRDALRNRDYWKREQQLWQTGRQASGLVEFGDRIHENAQGCVFVHFPDREEVLTDLDLAGLEYVDDFARADVSNESKEVRDFSDECRFWIARRRS